MESSSRRLVAYSFLVVFANDGTVSEEELEMMKRIAFEDGEIDKKERDVFRRIFSRLDRDKVADTVWSKIEEFCEENEISP